ncbi:DUF4177 domain-containing protein [Peribacillus loiseleuriae]|nr:DUF4177 domain-containing protein [Peribacillus loiseleuriae]
MNSFTGIIVIKVDGGKMIKYEYKTSKLESRGFFKTNLENDVVLNELGAEGWKAISPFTQGISGTAAVVPFTTGLSMILLFSTI